MNDMIHMKFLQKHDCKNLDCEYEWNTKTKYEKKAPYYQHILFQNEKCMGEIRVQKKAKDSNKMYDYTPETDEEIEFFSKLQNYFEKIAPDIPKAENMIPEDITIPSEIATIYVYIKGYPNYCEKFKTFYELGHPSVGLWLKDPDYKLQFKNEIIVNGKKSFKFIFEKNLIEWEANDITTIDLLDKIMEQFKTSKRPFIRDPQYLEGVCIYPAFSLNLETNQFQFIISID